MTPIKIAGWVALLVAVVAAFTDVPYAGALMVVLGVVVGYAIAGEDHVRVLVSALVLLGASHVLMDIPAAGDYLASIFKNFGTVAAGAALMIVTRNMWARFAP